MPKKLKPTQKFVVSYTYDIPHYADFIVEASSRRAALKIAQEALDDGRFLNVNGEACYSMIYNDRVFVHELEQPGPFGPTETMEEVIVQADKAAI